LERNWTGRRGIREGGTKDSLTSNLGQYEREEDDFPDKVEALEDFKKPIAREIGGKIEGELILHKNALPVRRSTNH